MNKLLSELPATFQQALDVIFATPALRVFLIFATMFVAQKIIDYVSDRYFERAYNAQAKTNRLKISKKRFDTLSKALRQVASVIIWVIGVVAILSALGVNIGALLAGAGVAGLAFGIAGKDIIMDLYVGLMALLEDQYRVGDVITIDQDHSGSVEEITLRTVKLRDIDGNMHIIPHSLARSIINKTYGYSVVNLELEIDYQTDLEKVRKIINDTGTAMAEEKDWKSEIIKPIQYQTMLRFDESRMAVRASGRVKPGKQWGIASEFRIRIKKAFDNNKIVIPFPQTVVRQINQDASKNLKK